MAIVEITEKLEAEIDERFKARSIEILEHLKSLEEHPKKGKALGHVGGIAIRELKYKGYRFYFITDAHRIRFYPASELTDLLLRFVRMSDKKRQQRTIDEIRDVLRRIGKNAFG